MNRRKLLKAISYLAAALITPFGFVAKAEQRLTTQQSDDEFDDGILPERTPNGSLIWAAPGGYYPRGFRKLIGELVCNRCHKTFKEHSNKELDYCIKNGGAQWEEIDRKLLERERELFELCDRMKEERKEAYTHKPGSDRCICDQCFETRFAKFLASHREEDR